VRSEDWSYKLRVCVEQDIRGVFGSYLEIISRRLYIYVALDCQKGEGKAHGL
jgi:hypothetical protein